MGNGTVDAAGNEAATAFNGQRGITVGHGRVPSGSGRGVWRFLILPPKDPSSSHPDHPGVYNVMTRN
ncbi:MULTISPECIES: hypothetical protein, partial [Mycobacterium]